MTIDATFWVAVSFFIFFGGLIYLKVPQKINNSLIDQINEMKRELAEAEKLKIEAKNLLSNYENKIDKSKKETKEIINAAKKESEKAIIESTKKFYQTIEHFWGDGSQRSLLRMQVPYKEMVLSDNKAMWLLEKPNMSDDDYCAIIAIGNKDLLSFCYLVPESIPSIDGKTYWMPQWWVSKSVQNPVISTFVFREALNAIDKKVITKAYEENAEI